MSFLKLQIFLTLVSVLSLSFAEAVIHFAQPSNIYRRRVGGARRKLPFFPFARCHGWNRSCSSQRSYSELPFLLLHPNEVAAAEDSECSNRARSAANVRHRPMRKVGTGSFNCAADSVLSPKTDLEKMAEGRSAACTNSATVLPDRTRDTKKGASFASLNEVL